MLRKLKTAMAPIGKRVLSNAATYSGLYRVAANTYGGIGIIFMLHRVVKPERQILYPGYMIHDDILDASIHTIRRSGWEFVSLDEMKRRLVEGNSSGRFVCFTADDGYLDNLEVALPIFQKHQVPLAVYVCTGLVDRSIFYWWGGLEELILTHDQIEVKLPAQADTRVVPTRTLREKLDAYDLLDGMCNKTGSAEFVRELFDKYNLDPKPLLDRDVMDMSQLRQFSQDPLVTIGAHCVTHGRLSTMSDAQSHYEIFESKRLMEEWLGTEVRHLAYPFGNRNACGEREFAYAKDAGFHTAVTTRRGNIFPGHRDFLQCLPRRGLPETIWELRNALSGVESLLNKRDKFQTV